MKPSSYVRHSWLSRALLAACLLALVGLWMLPFVAADVAAQSRRAAVGSDWLFVGNVGQFDPGARFLLLGGPGQLWLADDALWLSIWPGPSQEGNPGSGSEEPLQPAQGVNLRLSFVGAQPHPPLEPAGKQDVHVSYFLGAGPAHWWADVPVWDTVRYRALYPGIDLVLGAAAAVSDAVPPWHLQAGAGSDLAGVRLRVEGADSVAVVGDELRLSTAAGEVRLLLPLLDGPAGGWLERKVVSAGPGRFEVTAPYRRDAGTAGSAGPLGPEDLVFGTYLGGSSTDTANAVAIDSSRAVYVAGTTPSPNFPTVPGSFDVVLDLQDAYLVKFDPSGSSLVYATFLGGADTESSYGLALSGDLAFVAGQTTSVDFPTTSGAYDRTCGTDGTCNDNGEQPFADAFLVKLNNTGSALLYGTYYGGSDNDGALALAVEDDVAYFVGQTYSADLPTTNGAYDRTCGTDGTCNPYQGDPVPDAFMAKIAPAGAGAADLRYGTYLGGSYEESGRGVTVQGGLVYLTGQSFSEDLFLPQAGNGDVLVVKLQPLGNGSGDLVYGKLIGGSNPDAGEGIAVSQGKAYLTGETRSSNFPASNTYGGGFDDAFVARLGTGGALEYARFLGGSDMDYGRGLALNSAGQIVLTGESKSANFPVTPDSYDPSANGGLDVILVRLDLAEPDPIIYSTFVGGTADDRGRSIAVDGLGNAYVVGDTKSTTTWPTTPGCFDPSYNGGARDAVVAKLAVGPNASIALEKRTNGQDADAPPGVWILAGQPVNWTYLVTNTGEVALSPVTTTDNQGVAVSCPYNSLDPGASMVCTASGTAVAGQYANIGTATGLPPVGPEVSSQDPSHYFGAVPGIQLVKRTNGQDANSPPGPYILVGSPVTWEYAVTNSGNVALTNVTVTDDRLGSVCTIPSLAAGATEVCTTVGTASAGQYSNLGTVVGTPPVGPNVSATDPSHYFGAITSLVLVKKTNGQDANDPPGPYIAVGSPVTWEYVVTNGGNVALTNVVVTDDRLGSVCTIASLPAGGSQTCTKTGTAVAGQYSNLGTAVGTPPGGLPNVSDTDPSHYFGATTVLILVKKTNGEDANDPPGPMVRVGDPITWEYVVTNGGNVALTNVVVTDDRLGAVCTIGSLPAGGSQTCTKTGTAVAGQYSNLGTAVGTPPGGLPDVSDTDLSHYFGANPVVVLVKMTNGDDANYPPGPYIAVGGPVLWEYVVTNSGNVALTNVAVTDDRLGAVCSIASLPAGWSQTCTKTGTAVAGQYSNLGSVVGTPPVGPNVSDTDPSHYFGATTVLSLVKKTNGQDANDPPGPVIRVGDPVLWEYVVTNGGNVALTNVVVTDDRLGAVCTIGSLPAGGSQTCTKTGTAVAGQYSNLGTAVGTPPGGLPDVSDTDPSHYFGADPAVTLVKKTNGQDANDPPGPYILVGGAVVWEYVVTNAGNVALTDVAVTDDRLGSVCTIALLPVGQSQTCTKTGTAVAGQYSNLGSVVGTPPVGPNVSATDPSHYFGTTTMLTLVKKTNGQDANDPPGPTVRVGDPVTWEYVVTNGGNVALTNVVVTDDRLGSVCSIASLPAGGSQTCTKTGTAVAGQYSNLGTAVGTPPGGLPNVSDTDPSHYFGALLSLNLEKHTNGEDADLPPGPYVLPGDPVQWTYLITNTGNVELSGIVVVDDNGTPADPQDDYTCSVGTLAPGESDLTSCSQTGVAINGQYENRASAVGSFGGWTATDFDLSHYLGAAPGLDLEKLTSGQDADAAPGPYLLVGDPVTWKYVVANVGDLPLTNVTVVDDNGTPGNPGDDYTCTIAAIPPGGVDDTTCVQTGLAQAGQYENIASAQGTSGGTSVADADPSHYFGAVPAVVLVKKTNGQDANDPPGPYIAVGSPVTWEYVVTNGGNVALTNVAVTDDRLGAVCTIASLPAGASQTCTKTGTAVAGQYSNLGSVVGTPPVGPNVSDTDPSHYFGATTILTLVKKTNGEDANDPPGPVIRVGDPVLWEYVVTNGGNVALTNVVVTDDRLGAVCTIGSLPAGGSQTCTKTGTAVAGQYSNLGTAVGTPPGGLPNVSDTDPSHYYGGDASLSLVKKTNGQDANEPPGPTIRVGDAVLWEYVVTNDGNVALANLVVTDDRLGAVCTIASLPVGGSQTCTKNGTAVAGQYSNIGTAVGTPPVGPNVSDTDPSHYFGAAPSVVLVKKTNGQDANEPPGIYILAGGPVLWEYVVTNSGNVALTNVAVTDDRLGSVCTIASLPAGGSQTCTKTGTAAAGQYSNLGTVVGTPPVGPNVSDTDPSYYFGASPSIHLEKRTNGQDADQPPGPFILVGDPVLWEYEVTNTGNVPLTNITVTDNQGLLVTCPQAELGPGQSMACTATGLATTGQYANVGTAIGVAPAGPPVSDTDPSHYVGVRLALRLKKYTNGEDADFPPGPALPVGEVITWTYQLTNTGEVALTGIEVTDDKGVTVTCPRATLSPGEWMECSATGVAVAGQYHNIGTARGEYQGLVVSATDHSHYYGGDRPPQRLYLPLILRQ